MTFQRLEKAFREGVVYAKAKAGSQTKIIQTLIIMKLTLLIIMIASLQVQAKIGLGQDKITLSEKNADLEIVLHKISLQSGYQCFYKSQWLQGAQKINIEVKNASLEEVLTICFKNQPFTYSIIKNTIVVKEKATQEKLLTDISNPQAVVTVSGTVFTATGSPLASANVIEKETGRATITDAKGEFELQKVEVNNTLQISFVGYAPQQLKVKDATKIRVYLTVARNELDRIVVAAYGTTTQRLATGNIGSVRAEEIERHPITNALEALQGKVAGLVINQTSGYASAPFTVEIRGRNTINSTITTDPLYIIDGVPLTVLELGGVSSAASGSTGFIQNGMIGPASGQSPFFSLNPADIESVEVLKDADATAIYGSRGANGVILITTKKGKPGKTKLELNVYEGTNQVTRHWNMLNTSQYLSMRREAFRNSGSTPTKGSAPDLLVWDTTKYTDWQKILWGGIGKNIDAQAALTGGDAQTTFRLGAGYHYTTDITTFSGANQRAAVSFNLNHYTINRKTNINFSGSYSYAEANMITLPISAKTPPDAPPVYDKQGNLNFAAWDSTGGSFPFGSLLQPYDSKTGFLNTSLKFNFEIVKGLTFKMNVGYNNVASSQIQTQPIASQDPASHPTGSAQFGSNKMSSWSVEPQLEFTSFLSRGKINYLIGGTAQSSTTDGIYVTGHGYTDDALIKSISNAPVQSASENYGAYKYAGIFTRLNYDWEDKYIINLNARRDGSSRFGPGKQFGNFGSIGAAWIFTENEWFKKHLALLSFGKLRGSYGVTGSDAIGDYQYITQWSNTVNGLLAYNNNIPSLLPLHHTDSTYQWQVNKKLEIAIDLGFLKDNINLEIAYYRDRCGNQLVSFPTPVFTGFSNVEANLPANVQNSGLEILIKANIITSKTFTWSFNFNIGINRNKLLSYPNLAASPYASVYKIGKPLNIAYFLHYTGVDPLTGQYNFQDRNHDGQTTIDYSNPGIADDRYIYELAPKYTGGFEHKFRYKRLELTAFFYFKKQLGNNAYAGNIPGTMSNMPTAVVARWQKTGDQTNFARFITSSQPNDALFANFSDGILTDASFLRLKNLSLSYSLPDEAIKKIGLTSLNVFLRAENIFVITRYKGIDPEIQSFGSMPINRVITGGISLNF